MFHEFTIRKEGKATRNNDIEFYMTKVFTIIGIDNYSNKNLEI
jgi:hypothetical protein